MTPEFNFDPIEQKQLNEATYGLCVVNGFIDDLMSVPKYPLVLLKKKKVYKQFRPAKAGKRKNLFDYRFCVMDSVCEITVVPP